MKITYLNDENANEELFKDTPNKVAAIGFFDGIHLGHQVVINRAIDYAKKNGLKSAVVTFFPHPSVILNEMKTDVQYITPPAEKAEILKKLNVDFLYIIKFSSDLASMPPETFLNEFIISLNIKHLIGGFDFTFGYKGSANMENIEELSNNLLTSEAVPKVQLDGEKVSSTKIRKLMKAGDVSAIHTLLGRPLTTQGEVIHGFKRGRDIGYPTANMNVSIHRLLPKIGIYAVKVHYQSNIYYAMASLGFNPTFATKLNELKLEVNLFGFQGDLYGEKIILEWCKFIRNEHKYSGIEDLVIQIEKDEIEIKNYFNL